MAKLLIFLMALIVLAGADYGHDAPKKYPKPSKKYPGSPTKYSQSPEKYQVPPKKYPGAQKKYPVPPKKYPQPPKKYPEPPKKYPQPPKKYPQPPKRYPGPLKKYPEPPKKYLGPPEEYPEPPKKYPQPPKKYPLPQRKYPNSPNKYPQPPNKYPRPPKKYPNPPKHYPKCPNFCDYHFCDGHSVLKVSEHHQDRSRTGRICRKDGTPIGIIGSTGEARVIVKKCYKHPKCFTRISRWNPYGLLQKYTPSFFKSFNVESVDKYHKKHKGSGVGHETLQQNQIDFLNGRCFVLPLRAIQILDKKGNVVENVHPGKGYELPYSGHSYEEKRKYGGKEPGAPPPKYPAKKPHAGKHPKYPKAKAKPACVVFQAVTH